MACLAVPLLAVFGPVLFRDQQFAFRDAGHFYYPLLRRVQQEWEAGRWPLWAPEMSAGMPLLGNPTAAVLYPGKLIFFLLPHPWAVRAFTIGHVVLAYAAMWAMLRGWSVSATGSVIGALAYAFGVPVLGQASNTIFLVGAAWAPLGLLAADAWVRRRRPAAIPGLAAVLAMQVLGGDPEAAYVVVACAGGYALVLAAARPPPAIGRWLRFGAVAMIPAILGLLGLSWWWARAFRAYSAAGAAPPPIPFPPSEAIVATAWGIAAAFVARRAWRGRDERGIAATTGGLAVAAALAIAVAGAQLLPVLEYTGMSFRAARLEGFHDNDGYSAHPLQFLDAIWPNLYGTLDGGYRSWLNGLPPKPGGRLWLPSVYLGGLTLVLASAAAGFRSGPPGRACLTTLAVLGFLAGIGYYASPILWARAVSGGGPALGPIEPPFGWLVRADGYLRDGDGSVYWLLASALPGFGGFRYPPKLLVFWALAVAGLAGMGWDRVASGSRRAAVVAVALLAVGLIATAAYQVAAVSLRAWFGAIAGRIPASGESIDPARAFTEVRSALIHGSAIAAGALGIAATAARRPAIVGPIAVLVLMLDLILANAVHVVTVPQSAFEGEPRALELIREAERANPSPGPFRIQRVGQWWPAHWPVDGSRPYEQVVRWERDTLRPYFNLPLGVRSTFQLDTLEPMDLGLFFLPRSVTPDREATAAHGLKPGQQVWYYPRRGFDLWNTRYFLVPGRLIWDSTVRGYASIIPNSTALYPAPGSFDGPDGAARQAEWAKAEDFRILRNEAAYPRAWVVHRAYLLPEVRGARICDRAATLHALLYQADEFWRSPGVPVRDPRRVAWVETDRPREVDPLLSRAEPDPSETVTVIRDDPQVVELTAVLRSPGLVVISDLYYPGWTLTVDGRPAGILRTNRAMRGSALPAGTHHLVFRYDPPSFRMGIALSLAGLAALAALTARSIRRTARRRSS